MRICIIYHGDDFPPAERITKEVKTLSRAGHQLFVLCNSRRRRCPREERVGDAYAVRLWPDFRAPAVNSIVKFPAFVNPLWIGHIIYMARRFRIEALQVTDIPLAGAALFAGRLLGLPVVLDMWENYPEALRSWARLDWKRRIFKNPDLARAVERWVTPKMDHVITVVDEQKERLIADGLDPARISVVTNGVDMDAFTGTVLPGTPLDEEPAAYKLLYVGRVEVERGLADIIRALALVRGSIPAVRFFIVGAGHGNYDVVLRRIAEAEGVADLVRFIPWVPFDHIYSYVMKSDLCTVPHVYNDFINTTIPNKLFQYMAMGKTVLVSHAKPLARIVRECSCGFVFESGNPASAAAAIEQAYASRLDPAMGERGRRHALASYTWDAVSKPLIDLYARLEASRRSGPGCASAASAGDAARTV